MTPWDILPISAVFHNDAEYGLDKSYPLGYYSVYIKKPCVHNVPLGGSTYDADM